MNAENWVVKSNALIESRGSFTSLELKVIVGLISEIKIDDADFKEYEISVVEIKNAIESGNNAFYLELKNACEKLVSKTIVIEKEIDDENPKKLKKRKSFLITSYLSSAEYIDGENKLKVSFDPKLKPYLLDLKGNFTKYQLKNILTLKSQYSIRLYELTKPMEGTSQQKRTINLKELREILGLETNYKAFKDFEKYVLKVAEKEISEQTDVVLNYKKIKKGKPIYAIEFNVRKKDYIRTEEDVYNENTDLADKIRNKIALSKTFSDSQIIELYEIAAQMTDDLHHIDRFEYLERNYLEVLEKKPVHLFAYLKKALQNDFADACEKKAYELGLYN